MFCRVVERVCKGGTVSAVRKKYSDLVFGLDVLFYGGGDVLLSEPAFDSVEERVEMMRSPLDLF